jgi:AcrR family transcriptional regulator
MATNDSGERQLSRRERPAKPALTRESIIDTALGIMAEQGLGKVTMRRIAEVLDTGAASLYVYVRNTEDLHAQILDALLGRVEKTPAEGTWRERLTAVIVGYTEVLFDHHDIARMSMTTHPSGPNYLALLDRILGLLHEGGVADRDAAWAVDLLLAFATATAVEHGGDRSQPDLAGLSVELISTEPRTYPHLVAIGDEILSGEGPDRFLWGLDVLINGVLATPRPASTGQTSARSSS